MDAFLIDTPVQLLNAIKLICNIDGIVADVYIVPQFKNSNLIIERLKKSKLFNNVYVLEKPVSLRGYKKYIEIIFGILCPALYCSFVYKIYIKNKYDKIYFSIPTKMFDIIIASSNCSNVIGIEDGTGSYVGDIFHDYINKKYVKVRDFLGRGYKVSTMYLNNPDFFYGSFDCNKIKIPNNSEQAIQCIKEIFGYKASVLYEKYKIIYLNQPTQDFFGKYENEKRIISSLSSIFGKDILVRLHPRENNPELYSSMTLDNENNLWEIMAGASIKEEHVLIASFSTAQFIPKLLYDKEPIIIFTYKLFDGYGILRRKNWEDLIDGLKRIYKKKNRIYVVGSIDELIILLNKYVI